MQVGKVNFGCFLPDFLRQKPAQSTKAETEKISSRPLTQEEARKKSRQTAIKMLMQIGRSDCKAYDIKSYPIYTQEFNPALYERKYKNGWAKMFDTTWYDQQNRVIGVAYREVNTVTPEYKFKYNDDGTVTVKKEHFLCETAGESFPPGEYLFDKSGNSLTIKY